MPDMNVSLEISQETAEKIARAAIRSGKDLSTYLQDFVNRSFAAELAAPQGVDEILAPFRAEISQSGLTDQALDTLFSEARDESFSHRKNGSQG